MGGVLEPLAGEATSRSADGWAWAWVERAAAKDGPTAESDHPLEDPRLEEVVRLVRAELPGASVQAIREYLQMLDDRREVKRRLAARTVTDPLPDPKPARLGRRLGPSADTLASRIVDLLKHERR